jgi:hypothetical protein
VAAGAGGGVSTIIGLLGEGDGSDGAFLFEFSFVLSLALMFTPPMSFGFSVGEGEGELFVTGVADGFVTPPTGSPVSPWPVGGLTASTGWALGSAARLEPWGVDG